MAIGAASAGADLPRRTVFRGVVAGLLNPDYFLRRLQRRSRRSSKGEPTTCGRWRVRLPVLSLSRRRERELLCRRLFLAEGLVWAGLNLVLKVPCGYEQRPFERGVAGLGAQTEPLTSSRTFTGRPVRHCVDVPKSLRRW